MPSTSFYGGVPADVVSPGQQAPDPTAIVGYSDLALDPVNIATQVVNWRNVLWQNRWLKRNIWDECWALYRGVEDFSDKEDWQSRVTVPKAWASVKQATNVIKRLLSISQEPWRLDPIDPNNLVMIQRADKNTDITKAFMDNAKYIEKFGEGLESGFIMGLGVWKLWWGLMPRLKSQVETSFDANGMPTKQLTQKEILEGKLQIRAVDPYHFFWLPGSKLNQWVGTVEQIEIPKWELMQMADMGVFDKELVKRIPEARLNPQMEQSQLRFNELPFRGSAYGTAGSKMVRLTEYYGPILSPDGEVVEANAHVLIGGDSVVLIAHKNPFLHRRPPYVAFSPLAIPFRTEGTGLIEPVRDVDRAINKLARMSIDTLMFRLLPVFEVPIDAYENVEDFETGLTPGKIFRRNIAYAQMEGLKPIEFNDISQGAVQVQAQLDRAHQEGSLVSEIQQSLPRFRGVQTATEIEKKSEYQDSFFGNMAVEIEQQAIKPMVEMAWELIFQYLDTANDPRVANILGVHADVVRGMPREEIQEMIQGDFDIAVSGISKQLEKADMIQNLIQFMNLIGQNAQAWLPYINQDALLRRILEGFRPAIHDLDDIIADPATQKAKEAAMQNEQVTPEFLRMLPQLVDMAHKQQIEQVQVQQQQQQQALEQRKQELEEIKVQLDFALEKAKIDYERAKAKAEAAPHKHTG